MTISRTGWVGALGILVLAFGCGDDGGGADAGPDSAMVDGGSTGVAQPQIPWLADGVPPLEMPCPAGWHEVVDETGATSCDPYPASGQTDCAVGQAHFPGEASCRTIGRECPATDFGQVPASGTVVYVLAAAGPGGDGSVGAPYRALTDVPWATLTAGTTVAVGKGEYPGSIDLAPGTRVSGACAAETVFVGEAGVMVPVVNVDSPGVPMVLDNLAFRMTERFPIFVGAGSALEMQGVLFDQSGGAALAAHGAGASVTATDVVVQDTRQRGPSLGRGFDIRDGASLTVERAVFSGHFEGTVLAYASGTSISLTDTVIRDTGPGAEGFGYSVLLVNGATAELTRTLLDGATNVGMLVGDSGSFARMTDVIVRGTRPAPDGTFGQGMLVELGGAVEAQRLVVEDNHLFGLVARSPGTRVEITDAIFRDTASVESDGTSGHGVHVMDGASVTANRLLAVRNRQAGIAVFDADSSLEATDVVVRDTLPAETGIGGRGLAVEDGGRVVAERLVLMANQELGFMATHPGTELSFIDSAILDTRPQGSRATLGLGAAVGYGATLTATRFEIAGAHHVGLFAHSDGTRVTLTDVTVRDIEPEAVSMELGYGLIAQEGLVSITGERVLIQNTVGLGIAALGVGTSVSLSDVTVEGVRLGTKADASFGYGASAFSGSLTLDGFRVSDAAVCGLFVAVSHVAPVAGELDVSSGVVEGSPIGACVQIDGYDLERLSQDVAYRSNGMNLEATSLPVPGAVEVPD